MRNLLKKAELSINMIIMVAIGIIVLVIVIYLVVQQGQSGQKVISCPTLGGTCVESVNCGEILSAETDICTSGFNQVCCNPLTVRRT